MRGCLCVLFLIVSVIGCAVSALAYLDCERQKSKAITAKAQIDSGMWVHDLGHPLEFVKTVKEAERAEVMKPVWSLAMLASAGVGILSFVGLLYSSTQSQKREKTRKKGLRKERECGACGELYSRRALRCPSCGEANPKYDQDIEPPTDATTIYRLATALVIGAGCFWVLYGLVLDPLFFGEPVSGPKAGIGFFVVLAAMVVRKFLA